MVACWRDPGDRAGYGPPRLVAGSHLTPGHWPSCRVPTWFVLHVQYRVRKRSERDSAGPFAGGLRWMTCCPPGGAWATKHMGLVGPRVEVVATCRSAWSVVADRSAADLGLRSGSATCITSPCASCSGVTVPGHGSGPASLGWSVGVACAWVGIADIARAIRGVEAAVRAAVVGFVVLSARYWSLVGALCCRGSFGGGVDACRSGCILDVQYATDLSSRVVLGCGTCTSIAVAAGRVACAFGCVYRVFIAWWPHPANFH